MFISKIAILIFTVYFVKNISAKTTLIFYTVNVVIASKLIRKW